MAIGCIGCGSLEHTLLQPTSVIAVIITRAIRCLLTAIPDDHCVCDMRWILQVGREKIDRSSLLPSVRSSTQAPAPPLPNPYSLYRDESSFAISRACIVSGMSRASRCAVSLNPLALTDFMA